ncbi:MAG TPA: S8 family serine peptidase, partial [Blastocatellia bacterium]|nr:S8 family serine peptidase [Blastocatellia bacterium]
VNHGTAVLGELVAQDDGQGVTGIANQSTMGLINPQASASATDVAAAINRAAAILGPGDVILVEQQTLGLRYNPATGQGLVPIEFEPDVFAAIKAATSRGIVVIEPSSNGSENLDDAIYTGYFNRISHDSGAIVVGAGQASTSAHTDRAWFNESDYGLRVDVQGWGQGVATCGFGDVRLGTGQDFWYTTKFGGTSGAAAMVAGAAALLESIVKARNQPPLSPVALRQLLIVTGSGQAGDLTKHIGSRPDLKAAIAGLDTSLQPIQPVINSASYNPASGRLTIVGANFLPGNAIVRIDGMQVRKIKYPGGSIQPDGTATRIMTKGNITSMLPEGVIVQITVSNPATGLSSPMFAFSRP